MGLWKADECWSRIASFRVKPNRGTTRRGFSACLHFNWRHLKCYWLRIGHPFPERVRFGKERICCGWCIHYIPYNTEDFYAFIQVHSHIACTYILIARSLLGAWVYVAYQRHSPSIHWDVKRSCISSRRTKRLKYVRNVALLLTPQYVTRYAGFPRQPRWLLTEFYNYPSLLFCDLSPFAVYCAACCSATTTVLSEPPVLCSCRRL